MTKVRLFWRNGWAYACWQEAVPVKASEQKKRPYRTRWKALKTQDKTEAAQRLQGVKKELKAGKIKSITDGIRQTWINYSKEFLENIEARVEGSTYTLYSVALKKALDCWGDIPLPHITTRHLDRLITDMSRSGLKKPTINKNYRHIKHAIKQAQKWGYIKTLIEFPSQIKENKEKRIFPEAEISALFELLDKQKDQEFADLIKLAGYTGLRNGELLRLKIDDIDNPHENSLRITSIQKNKEESYIPINTAAREILERAVSRAREKRRSKLFRFNDRTHVGHLFKALMRSAGMDHHRFHDLRHTFCSYSIMSGNDAATTQRLARHKSIKTTQIYVDLADEYLQEASNKLSFELPKIRRVK